MFKTISDPGVRITCLGMACNLTIALVKLVGGWACNSEIIIADGWHSMTDLTSDVLTLATVSCGVRKSDKSQSAIQNWVHSFGSVGICGMLLTGGCLLGLRSVISLGEHFELMDGSMSRIFENHDPGLATGVSKFHAVWIAAATVVLKEWLYRSSKCSSPNSQSEISDGSKQ